MTGWSNLITARSFVAGFAAFVIESTELLLSVAAASSATNSRSLFMMNLLSTVLHLWAHGLESAYIIRKACADSLVSFLGPVRCGGDCSCAKFPKCREKSPTVFGKVYAYSPMNGSRDVRTTHQIAWLKSTLVRLRFLVFGDSALCQ
jgi:hypothetical protein